MPSLADFMGEDQLLELAGSNKRAVLSALVAAIGDRPGQPGQKAVLRGILDREDLRSTGIGERIALPHCKSAKIHSFAIAIGRTKAPIDYGTPDGEPVQVLAMISAPNDKPVEYLRVLSKVTRFLKEQRDALLNADHPRELVDLLRDYSY